LLKNGQKRERYELGGTLGVVEISSGVSSELFQALPFSAGRSPPGAWERKR